ncbi:hypothetical protein BVG79_01414 [Ketogulonicigenium robustum]|uniref:Uncharacterized protein n=1 Tax=Ketogulonicigenium robustum TaxID=92947 RepID=A0A1W6P0A9_9RHOB|nr:hypothetical protein BVG79_01414 [Ketogulonicigenium robustum]
MVAGHFLSDLPILGGYAITSQTVWGKVAASSTRNLPADAPKALAKPAPTAR